MSVETTVQATRRAHDTPQGFKSMDCRELTIEKPSVNGHPGDSLTVTLWEDGTIGVDTFTGWYREFEDEEPLRFAPEDTPDVVMAITEFLGSL